MSLRYRDFWALTLFCLIFSVPKETCCPYPSNSVTAACEVTSVCLLFSLLLDYDYGPARRLSSPREADSSVQGDGSTCVPSCVRGACVNGTCQCPTGYDGLDCSQSELIFFFSSLLQISLKLILSQLLYFSWCLLHNV